MLKAIRKAMAAVGTVVLLGLFTYKGVDIYYTRQLDDRYEKYAAGGGPGSSLVSRPKDFLGKIRYVRRLNKMESDFEIHERDFVNYLSKNRNAIGELTNSYAERSGHIEYSNRDFNVKPKQTQNGTVIEYIDKILNESNFSQQPFLELYFLAEGAKLGFGGASVSTAIKVLRFKSDYEGLTPEKKKAFDERQPGKTKTILDSYPAAIETIEYARKIARINVVSGTNYNDLMQNASIFADWHTHVRDSRLYEPSPMDIADSYLSGPGVVFTQPGHVMHVFGINRGQSREIFTADVK